jgi:hypothetical protein
MRSRFVRPIAIFVFLLIIVSGCGQSTLERPTATPAPSTPESSATVTTSQEISEEDEAVDIMWRIFGGAYGSIDKNSIRAAARNGHPGLVPVLVETASRTFEPDIASEISEALETITADSVGGTFVLTEPWFQWISRQDPPQVVLPGFDEWKGQLLGTIDPSFEEFLYADVETRIPIWSVEWGGVVRDGIPPLEFPKVRDGNAVDFLNLNEPVFGVTVNGESRAYPHRIMGWHELANDRLGGELITFVF